jgi:hypothetical protein
VCPDLFAALPNVLLVKLLKYLEMFVDIVDFVEMHYIYMVYMQIHTIKRQVPNIKKIIKHSTAGHTLQVCECGPCSIKLLQKLKVHLFVLRHFTPDRENKF